MPSPDNCANNASSERNAMKIGYFAIGMGRLANPAWIKTLATTVERLGFSTIWAPEHVVLLKEYASRYPYSGGDFPMPTETPIADPFITLTYAAACTSRVRLATGVCPVPEHNPVVLAKVIATADVLSGGRLMLGTGFGWLQEEYDAVGVPWKRRAHRMREYIEAMRALWAGDVVSYHGEFVNFHGVQSYPKPVNNKRVPIWFGGESAPALRRVAEYGDGWIGFNLLPDEAAPKIKRIHELMKQQGRNLTEVELGVSPNVKRITPDDLKRYRDLGIDEVTVVLFDLPRTERDLVTRLEQMARDYVGPAMKL
jgi:probable F420-dependent oxidoreductase